MEFDGFEWDDAKAAKNKFKHDVYFEEAKEAIWDALESETISRPFRSKGGEMRYEAFGDAGGRPLRVIFTFRKHGDKTNIRIISAKLRRR